MNPLVSEALHSDPDFNDSVQKILDTIDKHRAKITEIRPPSSERAQSYEETLKTFHSDRSMPLFYPYLGSGMGNGALVELMDGSVKYDLISGIGVHFGHSHPTLVAAALRGSLEDIAMQGNLQQNQSSFELTELLLKHSGMDHAILTTSGAMANENALKMIFQKLAPAQRVLAFERCFMGRTLALAQITDKPSFREGLPPTLRVDYIPFYDWRNPAESTERTLRTLDHFLARHPGQYACMCFELIQGEAGCYPGKQEFFIAIMEKLKKNGIAVLVDEVQTFGRTDSLFAFQHFGLQEYVDVVTTGKLLQTCATLFNGEWKPRPGLISQTFTGASSSIHVGQAIINSLVNEGYLGQSGKIMQLRKHFVEHLQKISDKFPEQFEGPFGYGLMIAVTPFKGDREKVINYAQALFKAGVITFLAGTNPTRIRFLMPAGGITHEQLDHVAEILEEELVKCLKK